MSETAGFEVASAYVSIGPSLEGFRRKFETQLNREMSGVGAGLGRDVGEKITRDVDAGLADLPAVVGGRFNALGATMLAGAGAAVAAFGVSSLRAFAEADQAAVQLQRVLETTPALADTNIERLNELNKVLERRTAIDGDSLAAAQAQLSLFGLTGRQIEALTPILADYAARTGKDAATAATDLGRALQGQGRALKAVGIDFTATGETASDLTRLMAELESKVGGSGAAFEESAAGGLASLNIEFGNLKEAVGETLVPLLDGAVDAMRGFSDAMPAVVGDLQDLTGAFDGLKGALDGLDLPDWLGPSYQPPPILDLFLPGLGRLISDLNAARTPTADLDAEFAKLGVTIDRATGKVTATGAALEYIRTLPPGATLNLEDLRAAVESTGTASEVAARQVDSLGNAVASIPAGTDVVITTNLATVINQANEAIALLSTLGSANGASSAAAAIRDYVAGVTSGKIDNPIDVAQEKRAEAARKAADAAKRVEQDRQRAAEAARRAADAAAERARQQAEAYRQQVADFARGVAETIAGFGAVTRFSARGLLAPTASQVTADMRARVTKARAFFPLVRRLQRLGLNRASLLEIIEAGPTAGTEIAQALLSGGGSSIREVNSLESQLQATGAALGGLAASVNFAGAAPQVDVTVYIGNEQLDGRIDSRIAGAARSGRLAAARGTRTA